MPKILIKLRKNGVLAYVTVVYGNITEGAANGGNRLQTLYRIT